MRDTQNLRWGRKILGWLLVAVWFGGVACVEAKSMPYKDGEEVPLIANKVGPFSNPSEMYAYYSLPFCEPDKFEHQPHDLGEILSGDRKVKTPYEIRFKQDLQWQVLCKKPLDLVQVKLLQKAVEQEYYFEMFLDGLPIWGYVGDTPKATDLFAPEGALDVAEQRKFVYNHLVFQIQYNGDRIIAVNATALPSKKVDITEDEPIEIEYSYSVRWEPTNTPFQKRMNRYQKMHFLPASFEIHWLSIINSFVLVVLLTVFLAIILMRVLKNDFSRYMQADEDEDFSEEETGWKLVHGDVFRFPENKMVFTAILGAGSQLFSMVVLVLLLALLSVFTPSRRGAIATASIVMYALTAGIGGYVSARYYKQLGGTKWVWNTVLCAVMFPAPLFAIFLYLNSVAVYHESSAALPFGTIMVVFSLYLFLTFPLTVVGAIAGRTNAPPFDAPCRTTKVPRQIPDAPWYRHPVTQMFIAGFLPFSAIYIELHYIFASVWGHKIYTLFGILFLAFIMLLIVTAFITIALIYFQLASEDHRWWWRSIMYGGSTGIFVYAYCFFYYYERSEMSGFMQTSFYFGYMLVVSYGFFMLLGTVGFFSALTFVRHIYGAIKCD